MTRGGPRNRGPLTRTWNSEAARQRFAGALVLPADGYSGEPPSFPLPGVTPRELEVWAEAWRTPQAYAWSTEHWRWRTVALWVRWTVRCEDPDAPAALGNVTVRLADQIGLTPAGLTDNQWRVSDPVDQPAAARPVPSAVLRQRAGITDSGDSRPSSLERARRRAEERDRTRDPREALRDESS